ncbi:MAG: OadG family protein [Anaerolineae bacterium]
MSAFQQGLIVTVQGMALVFASLGLLMLIIAGLERLFRQRQTAQAVGLRVPPLAGGSPTDEELAPEIVAAIGVAFVYWHRQRQELPPPETTVVTFQPGSGAWRALGRLS